MTFGGFDAELGTEFRFAGVTVDKSAAAEIVPNDTRRLHNADVMETALAGWLPMETISVAASSERVSVATLVDGGTAVLETEFAAAAFALLAVLDGLYSKTSSERSSGW